jgi:uncharacterized membrane-anchored protein
MRNAVLWGVLAMTLVVANWAILGKERILSSGQTVLIQLAPRDPRSLLQGDYMALRYVLAEEIMRRLDAPFSATGAAVVRLDANGVAEFVRLADAADAADALAEDERLLGYRKRGASLRLAGEAFFFEEGQQELFANARYGELRVDTRGNGVLVGLRDAEFNVLGPSAGAAVSR